MVHFGLGHTFPLLVFALACPGSPERRSEVVLALEWVSQFLSQWMSSARQAQVYLCLRKHRSMTLEVDHLL